MRGLDVEVWKEDDLQQTGRPRVGVDRLGDGVDQLDDQLRHEVAGGRLAAEDHRSGRQIAGLPPADPAVERNHVQDVQVLAFVFVNSLHLDVEERIGIGRNPGARPDDLRQELLVAAFDRPPAVEETGVPRKGLQFPEPGQILDPRRAYAFGDERGERRIGKDHEAPGRHAVGHVQKFLRGDPVEVVQDLFAQQIGMQAGHAVDPAAADAGKIRHPDVAFAALVDEGKSPDQVLVPRMVPADVA